MASFIFRNSISLFIALFLFILFTADVMAGQKGGQGSGQQNSPAGEEIIGQINKNELLSFADDLYDEKDYYRAITEYKRLIFYFPSSRAATRASFKIALSYLEGKRYEAALSQLSKFRQLYPTDPLAIEALFLIAEASFNLGNYDEALEYFKKVESDAISPEIKERAAAARGWCLARKGNWSEAADLYSSLKDGEGGKKYGKLSKDLTAAKGLPQKSPALAGTLSAIIPGSGQLYIGRKQDALVAFLLNGAFIAGAMESFRKDEDATGAILLFFEAGWYAGNIYSATSGAHKYNRKSREDLLYKLEREYSLGVNGKGTVFGTYRFRF
ncbi:MAG: tetratricopeptide repeat protein [bacterium]|nr:tetratricopeptide repeat protein [bacterium]